MTSSSKTLDYSKWDKIELSDDEDVECHPNIDKASWVRWRQADIHRKREERKLKIAQLRQEHNTNDQLLDLIQKLIPVVKGPECQKKAQEIFDQVDYFERERKHILFDEKSPEFLHPKDIDEVFAMLMSRLISENQIAKDADSYAKVLPKILVDEVPKLIKRQKEVVETIANEEAEQNKKLTSENMFKEKFSKTVINPKASSSVKQALGKTEKRQTVELLNPGYEKNDKDTDFPEVDLRELTSEEEKLMLNFAQSKDFEHAYKFIQDHPQIVGREFSDHLMARAFRLQMDGKDKESRNSTQWSLALNYSMQMGQDGVGLFFKKYVFPRHHLDLIESYRMINGGPLPLQVFKTDVENSYARIKERSKILKEKNSEMDAENSNLTPEQAQSFNNFPKFFQDALLSNDIERINEAFAKMSKDESDRIMKECQDTGLITVLSEEEAAKYTTNDSE